MLPSYRSILAPQSCTIIYKIRVRPSVTQHDIGKTKQLGEILLKFLAMLEMLPTRKYQILRFRGNIYGLQLNYYAHDLM